MFKFSGKRPDNLGIKNGRFTAPPTWKPNWVNSQVNADDPHHVAPLPAAGDAKSAIGKVAKVVEAMPRATIVRQDGGYLYAEFRTALMGYVDDVEFHADGKAVQVRSSSRLGVRDFDVNRKRVEAIRKALNK